MFGAAYQWENCLTTTNCAVASLSLPCLCRAAEPVWSTQQQTFLTVLNYHPLSAAAAAAAEFICHEKNIHVYINVKDRRAARKE